MLYLLSCRHDGGCTSAVLSAEAEHGAGACTAGIGQRCAAALYMRSAIGQHAQLRAPAVPARMPKQHVINCFWSVRGPNTL